MPDRLSDFGPTRLSFSSHYRIQYQSRPHTDYSQKDAYRLFYRQYRGPISSHAPQHFLMSQVQKLNDALAQWIIPVLQSFPLYQHHTANANAPKKDIKATPEPIGMFSTYHSRQMDLLVPDSLDPFVEPYLPGLIKEHLDDFTTIDGIFRIQSVSPEEMPKAIMPVLESYGKNPQEKIEHGKILNGQSDELVRLIGL